MEAFPELFAIGLSPVPGARWFEVDAELARYLAEKERLYAADPAAVFAEEPGTRDAQRAVLDAVAGNLEEAHGDFYRRRGGRMAVGGRRIALDDGRAPLLAAARLVQDDLMLMRRERRGWRLAAASVSFPSSWSLREKFGKPLEAVHAPVPGFSGGTRAAAVINRILDNLSAGRILLRRNWGVYPDDRLDHSRPRALERIGAPETVFIRMERQTIRKMAGTGDVVFAVKIRIEPLASLIAGENGPENARRFLERLRAMRPEELRYKGLDGVRARLVELVERARR